MQLISVRPDRRGFLAECPNVLGCMALSRSKADAIRLVRRSIQQFVRARRGYGLVRSSVRQSAWVHRPMQQRKRLGWG